MKYPVYQPYFNGKSLLTTVLIRHGYHPKESTLNVLRENMLIISA